MQVLVVLTLVFGSVVGWRTWAAKPPEPGETVGARLVASVYVGVLVGGVLALMAVWVFAAVTRS